MHSLKIGFRPLAYQFISPSGIRLRAELRTTVVRTGIHATENFSQVLPIPHMASFPPTPPACLAFRPPLGMPVEVSYLGLFSLLSLILSFPFFLGHVYPQTRSLLVLMYCIIERPETAMNYLMYNSIVMFFFLPPSLLEEGKRVFSISPELDLGHRVEPFIHYLYIIGDLPVSI